MGTELSMESKVSLSVEREIENSNDIMIRSHVGFEDDINFIIIEGLKVNYIKKSINLKRLFIIGGIKCLLLLQSIAILDLISCKKKRIGKVTNLFT